MPLIPLAPLLQHALKHRYAIPAFNISFQEQATAILDAAAETGSPVIIQFSQGGLDHAAQWFFEGLREHIKQSSLPICLHRDHCHSLDAFNEAVALGFSSIMMDGSLTASGKPNSLEDNITITQQAIALARPSGISVEAELGCLGSLETGLSGEEDGTQADGVLNHQQLLTDPQQAKDFIFRTGADALAIAIGTSHGAYKFSTPPTDATLDIPRVTEIAEMIPETPLVLHGSSSVPSHLCESINQHGGSLPTTYGVPVGAIRKAIQQGVAKVNIDTDLRLASTAGVRVYLSDHSDTIDPRKYLGAAYQAMKTVCIDRYSAFGCAGKADLFLKEYYETDSTTFS
jgi:fructose-bisphosphate aldolase, class II